MIFYDPNDILNGTQRQDRVRVIVEDDDRDDLPHDCPGKGEMPHCATCQRRGDWFCTAPKGISDDV